MRQLYDAGGRDLERAGPCISPPPCGTTAAARLVTSESEPSKVARTRDHLTAGGLVDLVEMREGNALETLSVDLPETIDLLLLDGAKALYPEILSLVESRLRPGVIIVADDADRSPEYLARVRSSEQGYMSTPFGEDVELSMRLG